MLNRVFLLVAKSKSQEAFLAVILLTVIALSTITEGLGLSGTLGAFLAGTLLSETKYTPQVWCVREGKGVARGGGFDMVMRRFCPVFEGNVLGWCTALVRARCEPEGTVAACSSRLERS